MSNGLYHKLQEARAEIKRIVTSSKSNAGISVATVVVEITTRYPMSRQQVISFLRDLHSAGLVTIRDEVVFPCQP